MESIRERGVSVEAYPLPSDEASLRQVLSRHARHYHEERNHQGKDNMILFPVAAHRLGSSSGKIRTRERLGGLLKFYHREAA